jgi:hypothetical protein
MSHAPWTPAAPRSVPRASIAVGTAYSAVTPCDANDAPAVCPAPGFPPNYLATDNLKTGALTPVKTLGPRVHPQGMIFIRF